MKITDIKPLAADPAKIKLYLEDGSIVHVRRDDPLYAVGDDYGTPPSEQMVLLLEEPNGEEVVA